MNDTIDVVIFVMTAGFWFWLAKTADAKGNFRARRTWAAMFTLSVFVLGLSIGGMLP